MTKPNFYACFVVFQNLPRYRRWRVFHFFRTVNNRTFVPVKTRGSRCYQLVVRIGFALLRNLNKYLAFWFSEKLARVLRKITVNPQLSLMMRKLNRKKRVLRRKVLKFTWPWIKNYDWKNMQTKHALLLNFLQIRCTPKRSIFVRPSPC